MTNSILGKRLKELREERGYLQKFVADKLGIKSNTLSGYENGTRMPDPEMLSNLADLYHVSTDYLLGRTDTKEPPIYDKDEEEFQAFINNPELNVFYKELPKSNEEAVERLREIWEIIKKDYQDRK